MILYQLEINKHTINQFILLRQLRHTLWRVERVMKPRSATATIVPLGDQNKWLQSCCHIKQNQRCTCSATKPHQPSFLSPFIGLGPYKLFLSLAQSQLHLHILLLSTWFQFCSTYNSFQNGMHFNEPLLMKLKLLKLFFFTRDNILFGLQNWAPIRFCC